MKKNNNQIKFSNKKLSLSICISALNEEQNITNILDSLLRQKRTQFSLKEILIVSDGSVDSTVKKIRKIKSEKINLIVGKKRLGQSIRLRQMFNLASGDVIVRVDADILLDGDEVLDTVMSVFTKDQKLTECCINREPLIRGSFVEKAIKCSFDAYWEVVTTYKSGNNHFTVGGAFQAFRKDFVKQNPLPNIASNDDYYYLLCRYKGLKFQFIKNVKFFYTFPSLVRDHIKQTVRFNSSKERLSKYFPKNFIDKEYYMPYNLLVFSLAKQFMEHPVLSLYIFLVNFYCRFVAKYKGSKVTGRWEVAVTTKKI